jgi:hypothetical protein
MNRHLWRSGALVLAILWGAMGGDMNRGSAQETAARAEPSSALKPAGQYRQDRPQGDATQATAGKEGRGPDAKSGRNALMERRARLERQIREWMAKAGVNDESSQSAIIAHISGEVRARRPLRDAGRKLFQSMQADTVPEEQMRSQLAEYHAALEADKARRQAAEADLDAKIHYTQKPRLEAMLLVFGIIGDGPLLIPGSQRGGAGGQGESGSWQDRGRSPRGAGGGGPGELGEPQDKRRRDGEFRQKEQSPAEQAPGTPPAR